LFIAVAFSNASEFLPNLVVSRDKAETVFVMLVVFVKKSIRDGKFLKCIFNEFGNDSLIIGFLTLIPRGWVDDGNICWGYIKAVVAIFVGSSSN